MQTFRIRMLAASLSFVALTACQVSGHPMQIGAAANGPGSDVATSGAAAVVGASDAARSAQSLCGKINGRPVSDAEIRQFLADVVTPRFPGGFTTWRTQGQWLDRDTRHVVREEGFVVNIVATGTQDTLDYLGEIRREYIKRFRQQAVGLVLTDACGSF